MFNVTASPPEKSSAHQPEWPQRMAYASVRLAVFSGCLWFLIHGPLAVDVSLIDPAGYASFFAMLFGVCGGLLAFAVAGTQMVKRQSFSTALRIAVFIGVPTLAWNGFMVWLVVSWLLYCADGPCH